MTIHFFVGKNKTSATARYRGYLVVEKLKSKGIDAIIHEPLPGRPFFDFSRDHIKEIKETIKIFYHIYPNDIIYLVRTIFRLDFVMIALFFKLFGKRKIIFDYDDAIYLKKFARIRSRLLVWLSNYNVVANHHLAEWAEKYNKNVEIIPTCVSLSLCQSYSRYMRLDNNTFTIGWIGHGVNHVKNLKLLVPVFSKLIEKGVNFRFVVVGSMRYQPIYDLFNSIKGLQVEFIDKLEWSNVESSPKVIQKFDIGVMPLVSDSKTLGKSAFKAIEYMACAVPPVISPVGENNFLIKDGINGFFADNTEEWVEKIEKLYCQPKLCDKIGKIAQKTIKGKYSYNINIPKFINIFKKIDEKN